MKRAIRSFITAVAAVAILLSGVSAKAETCTLKLKRRESKSGAFDWTSYMFWSVRAQYVYAQMHAGDDGRWQPSEASGTAQLDAFKRIVTKEPKYHSDSPFRGVVKLGSHEYAFALDVAAPTPAKPRPQARATARISAKSAGKAAAEEGAKPAGPGLDEKSRAKSLNRFKALAYNRLYFDSNHNGDLTDDKVVDLSPDSEQALSVLSSDSSYLPFEFPRIDLAIDVEGTKADYSFFLGGYANGSPSDCTVMVNVSAAVCREGDITLEGKRHHVVLLDYNCNGRFDDRTKVSAEVHMANGQLYPEMGDMLLIDPKFDATSGDSPYDPTASEYRCHLAEMVSIDGKWYDLKVSPAGDRLTLTPSTVALGNVTNHNQSFRALIYSGDRGFVKICGAKDAPVPVPEGQWKLYSYTITHTELAKPAVKAAEKTAQGKTEKHGSLLAGLAQAVQSLGGGPVAMHGTGPSIVSATATEKYKAVTVRKTETVELPFGPPYTPTVTAVSYGVPNGQGSQTFLEMSLVGVTGEVCTNMMVDGARPGKPAFTITDPKGKVVQQGDFEYG